MYLNFRRYESTTTIKTPNKKNQISFMLSSKFLFVTQGLLLEKRYMATQACKQAPSVGDTFLVWSLWVLAIDSKTEFDFFYIYIKFQCLTRWFYISDYPRFQNSVKTIKLIKTQNSSVISVHYPVKTNESWAPYFYRPLALLQITWTFFWFLLKIWLSGVDCIELYTSLASLSSFRGAPELFCPFMFIP